MDLGLAARPIYVARRLAYKLYERRHPDEPWLAQGAIRFLNQALPRDGVGLEWGSGRSTQWFGSRLRRLVSIEMDEDWYRTVNGQTAGLESVDLRHINIEHPIDEPSVPEYHPVPQYVAVIEEFAVGSLDFVLVDGHYRQACVRAALSRVRPGGLLAVDNTDWMPLEDWGVPRDWPLVHQSSNVMTQTTVWRKPDAS
jgi:hypothetical protein